jgi:hypothetical protein
VAVLVLVALVVPGVAPLLQELRDLLGMIN